MADIRAVDKFFGLEPDDWVEMRYGDVLLMPGDLVVENLETGLDIPIKVATSNPGTDEVLLSIAYQEIVVSVSTTVGARNARTGLRADGTITIQNARYATDEDMLEVTAGTPYPTTGTITATLADQDGQPGIYWFPTPLCRQKRPVLLATELPAILIWAVTKEGTTTQSDIYGGFVYRPGAPEVA